VGSYGGGDTLAGAGKARKREQVRFNRERDARGERGEGLTSGREGMNKLRRVLSAIRRLV